MKTFLLVVYHTVLADPLLPFIIASSGLLFLLSLAFGLLAIKYRRQNDRMAARWRRLEAEWEPLVVAALVGDQPPDTVWAHVARENRLFFIDFITRYAKRLRGETAGKITELVQPYLKDVVEHLQHGAPAQRARAVQSLGLLAFSRHTGDILKALDDESPLVAMIAARTMARIDHPQFVKPVLDRLNRFENWSPKFLAAMLAEVGPGAAGPLREAYADHAQTPHARAVAAEALRWLNDLPAAEIAAGILAEEMAVYVAEPGLAEERRRIFELAIKRSQEAAPSERPAAAPVHEPTRTMDLEEDAFTHFQDPHRDLIASSLRLLRTLGRPEHAAKARGYCDARDFVLRAYALRALGRLGDPADVPLLLAAFDDPSVWVTLHAARAIRELGGNTHLRQLAERAHPRAEIARQVLAEAA